MAQQVTPQFVYSDSSSFAWGGLFAQKSLVSISDYWLLSSADLDITTKETKALTNTLLSFGDNLRDARVDAYVDNQSLAQAWQSQAARSSCFSDVLKQLSKVVLDLNVHLSVIYISSNAYPADQPSCHLSHADSKLAFHLWQRFQSHPSFGGTYGHSVDLMALESNSQSDLKGSESQVKKHRPPVSPRVNIRNNNSALQLISSQVIKHLPNQKYRRENIWVAKNGVAIWLIKVLRKEIYPGGTGSGIWSEMRQENSIEISCKGEQGMLLTPSLHGFSDSFKLPWDLGTEFNLSSILYVLCERIFIQMTCTSARAIFSSNSRN